VPITSAGPSWTDIMTAFGTVGAVVAALSIAVWSDVRTGQRLRMERQAADERLRLEQDHSDAQLAEERQLADARLQAERESARDREQLAEAYAVQVLTAVPEDKEVSGSAMAKVLAIVVNHGRYAISDLEAQLHVETPGNTELVGFVSRERIPGREAIDPVLLGPVIMRQGLDSIRPAGMLAPSNLTPWDRGVRFESDAMTAATLQRCYPIARWTDRWGTRWEYRLGQARQIARDEPWVPLTGGQVT
jgi:hypothetical protein